VATELYEKPYLDSALFISWVKDTDPGELIDGTHGDRRPVSEGVLLAA
jgi:hypothetical protein